MQAHQNHTLCQKREGLLFSKCQSGLGPAVQYTHQCVECQWYGWLLYIASVFIPAIILCLIIIPLRINLLSLPMNAKLVCSVTQWSLMPTLPYVSFFILLVIIIQLATLILFVLTIYGFLNIHFFAYVLPEFCIREKMFTLQVVSLDYIVALFPLIFTGVIYIFIEVHGRGFRQL